MNPLFALPLGNPPSSLSGQALATHLNALRNALKRGPLPFSGDEVFLEFTLKPNAPSWANEVHAPWAGALAAQAGSMVTLELPPSVALDLTGALPHRAPVPRRVTLGPLRTPPSVDQVNAGQALGPLQARSFRIGFEDALGTWIDPAWCLQQFEELGLFSVPRGNNPFVKLLPAGEPIGLAGPELPPQKGRPMLVVSGGQPALRLFNPGTPGLPGVLPFVSSDTLVIGVFNFPADHKLVTRIEDRTDGNARSSAGPFLLPDSRNASIEFKPDRDLRPQHPPYQPGAGSSTLAAPLRYLVSVDVQDVRTGALTARLSTTLEQGRADILRQAYVFHGPPFQPGASLLPPPPLKAFMPPAPATGLLSLRELFTSAYVSGNDTAPHSALGIDCELLHHAGEWIRRRYSKLLFEDNALPASDLKFLTADLVVARAWTDPELNEQRGDPIDHPSQWALSVDLAPFHTHLGGTLFQALARAATEFLTELRRGNPGATFADTSVRLQLGPDEVWRWTVNATGVTEQAGARYPTLVGGPPSSSAAAAAAGTAADAAIPTASPTRGETRLAAERSKRAATVSIRFIPTQPARPLTLPPIAAYPAEPPLPTQRRCLIVLGGEHPSAPQDRQIPIDVVGKTLERELRLNYPGDLIETKVIEDPVALLAELGAFHTAPASTLRSLFILSHAEHHVLQLLHGSGLPSVHAPAVADQLHAIYGRLYKIGTDDFIEFKTHQFRSSNLLRLPGEMKRRLRRRLALTEDICLMGCRSGGDHQGISAVFAKTLNRPVLGAGNFSKFYIWSGAVWTAFNAVRGTPTAFAAYNTPALLLPAEQQAEPIKMSIGDPLNTLAIYRSQLTRFDPNSPLELP